MKPPSSLSPTTITTPLLLALLAAAPATTIAATTTITEAAPQAALDCANLLVDGHKYNLQALAGPHVVVTSEYTRPTWHNSTYAVDVCGVLKRKEGVGKEERCPDGSRVCAIKHRWDPKTGKTTDTDQIIPIVVGDDTAPVTWEAKRLPRDDDAAKKDGKKEGLKLSLQGATTYQQRAQRTVVEFRCNPDLVGTEAEWESVDEYVPANARREEDKKDGDKKEGDESTPETQLKKDGAALVWEGYKREKAADGKDTDTLYLTWYTKHACDAAVDEPPPASESSHWGFFTWLVILVFLAIATYLIFGSWLNYNRYGARGWDLLPHGDTLRDVPYLMKDLIRRLLNTLQGAGSRGGYSAV